MANVIRSKASERLLTGNMAVDVLAGSPQMRQRTVVVGAGQAAMVVQNTSKDLTFTAVQDCKIVGAYLNVTTAPACAGGTSTLQVDRIATDGSTATVVVTAVTILSGVTASIANSLTLAATNPTSITAGQTVRVRVTTSNNAVGTADTGLSVTFLVEPVEATVISDSTQSTANT